MDQCSKSNNEEPCNGVMPSGQHPYFVSSQLISLYGATVVMAALHPSELNPFAGERPSLQQPNAIASQVMVVRVGQPSPRESCAGV